MNAIGLSVLKSGWKWVSDNWAKETSVNQILEPFSTLLKLAIFSYKADGTKIAIYKNKLPQFLFIHKTKIRFVKA